jgi:hypothetical protein
MLIHSRCLRRSYSKLLFHARRSVSSSPYTIIAVIIFPITLPVTTLSNTMPHFAHINTTTCTKNTEPTNVARRTAMWDAKDASFYNPLPLALILSAILCMLPLSLLPSPTLHLLVFFLR